MPFEPIDPLGGFTATDELPKPQESVLPDPTTSETFGAAFRTDNTIGSLLASEDAHFAGTRIDPDFDPWGAIAGTPYEPYYENFARAANKEHFEAIKSDINRENKDRDIMGRSGWTGLGASLVAGTVDWPIIIPGGQVVRSAKGGVSLLKTALSTGVAGGIAGAASEVMLQNTQQLRTAEESAMVIGGSAVLSGILGAGIGKLVARSDFVALAPRIERDLTVPGVDKPDHFEPGSFGAKVEAAPGASAQATAIADALRQTAAEILPPQVRVQVVDSLGPVGDDGLYAIRAYHGSGADFDSFDLGKVGSGEGSQVMGRGIYLSEDADVAGHFRDLLDEEIVIDGGKLHPLDDNVLLRSYAKLKASGDQAALDKALQNKRDLIDTYRERQKGADDARAFDRAIAAAQNEIDIIERVKSGDVRVRKTGQLYEVDIDVDQAQLLDWRKPLAEHPAAEKLRELAARNGIEVGDDWSGSDLFRALEDKLPDAGQALKDAGAPGIRYPADADATALKPGTSNIVIFDDSLLKITAKNGEPVTAAQRKEVADQLFSIRGGSQINTPEFKRWFGDSKVVDEGGNPLMVYSGLRDQQAGESVWLTDDKGHATGFGDVGEFFVRIVDPFRLDMRNFAATPDLDRIKKKIIKQYELDDDEWVDDIQRILDRGGWDADQIVHDAIKFGKFDGAILENWEGNGRTYLTRNGDQVKPAQRTSLKSSPGKSSGGSLSLRGAPSGPIAEGRFDPNKLLITIAADALDPLKTLRHESIHALKQMGLFTAKEWQTLEAAAKKRGWIESNNVRALYEDLYRDGGKGGRFSIREQVKEQLDEIFDEFAVRDIESLRRLKDELPADAKELRRLFKEQDRLETRDVEQHFGADYEGSILGAPMSPEAEAVSARIQALLEKYKTEDYEFVVNLSQELRSRLAQAEKLHARMTRSGEKYSVRTDGAATGTKSTTSGDPKLESLLIEEAIAEQFSLWRQGASKVTGVIAKLFERMQQFLERTGNALRGRGFQTADDVFEAIGGGDVAMRAPGARAAPPIAGVPGMGRGASVGAAARDRADDALKSAFGMEKAMSFQDPMLRLQTSPSPVSNRHVQELAETPLTYEKNVLGEETAPLGTELGAPGAVESRVKIWTGVLADAVESVDEQWLRYREVWGKNNLGKRRALTLRDTLFGSEALTHKQFKAEVSKSLRRKDTHAISEVAAAAREVRQKLLDPLKDEAIRAELLPEGVSVETAESYLMRLYNKDLIIAERDQFKKVVADWLTENEAKASARRGRLSKLVDQAEEAEAGGNKDEAAFWREEIEKELGAAKLGTRADEDGPAPKPKGPKAILNAARKIVDEVEREPGEIGDLADQIIDRIIGTPDGRLPYDADLDVKTIGPMQVTVRGPLAPRDFMIPDAAIERWLENDIETIMRAYTRTMAPDVEIAKRFGSVDMKMQMKEIQEDYARRSAAAKTPAERKKINKQRVADIRDLGAIRDRIRGTYALPSNPDGYLVRTGRVVSSLNYMRMLGGMTLSAIPDLGGIVLHHGVMNTVGDGIIPLFRNWSGARLARGEVKRAGTALEMVLDSRAMSMADIMDDHGRHTKFERGVQAAARNFGVVSLQSQWNSGLKQFTGLVTMTRMLRAAEAVASGKIKPRELERLAAAGISQSNARKIAEQFAKHGRKEGGVWFANTAQWDAGSRPAIDAFRVALVRDVDRIIITPGQDRPLWMSTEMGRLIGQFKSFSIAAMQRIVIAGLQQRDMGTLNGIILMTALGGLVGILKAKVAGQPVHSEWSDKKKNAQFLVEAIDRSGLTGWLMEVNSMTEKMSGGAIGLSAITGKPVSRYAQRNITSSILGPSIGTIEDAYRVTKKAAQREWTQSDSRVMRRLIPYNNIFYARAMFDKAEAGINGFFGVPKPAGAR